MNRQGFIGSSDVGVILGLNPFKTALQLWGEKTGKVESPDLSDNEAIEWGTRLERVVSQKFAEKNKVKLIAFKKRFVHPEYDYMSCELDNIIAGTDETVEIKTCNAWAFKQWKDENEIPAYIICQVMFALGLSKRKVGHIAVLCGGQRYLEKKIEFDQEMFDTMVERVKEFWQMVQDETPPMAVEADNQSIVKIYPESDDQIQQVEEFNDSIAMLQQTKMHIAEMEKEKAKFEVMIKERIGANLGIQTSEYVVKWSNQDYTSVDTQQLKDDELYDKYKITTSTRVMRVRKNKEKNING